MRYKHWFLAFLGTNIVVTAAVLFATFQSSSALTVVHAVLLAWLITCAYKLAHAAITHIQVLDGYLVYRDRLLRARRVAVPTIRRLTYITGARLEVEMDDGSRLVLDPRLMVGVHAFIETVSAAVTRHRTLIVSGDLS
jgi:hypothetical protein